MQTVFAYRDSGWMSSRSRWKPRRIFCTEHPDHRDQPGREHVVKFRQGKAGTAALISEVLCTQLLAAGGVSVLDARLVEVSGGFAASYVTKTEVPYSIEVGPHFGTLYRHDVENGPPLNLAKLAKPQEVVDIWAFDSWLCNIDRNTYGNILLAHDRGGMFLLIAADQSDCFGGSGCLADGSWDGILRTRGPAKSVAFWQEAIYAAGGKVAIQAAMDRVKLAEKQLDGAIRSVPRSWWQTVGLDSRHVTRAMAERRRRLPEILNLRVWEGLSDAINGGHPL